MSQVWHTTSLKDHEVIIKFNVVLSCVDEVDRTTHVVNGATFKIGATSTNIMLIGAYHGLIKMGGSCSSNLVPQSTS